MTPSNFFGTTQGDIELTDQQYIILRKFMKEYKIDDEVEALQALIDMSLTQYEGIIQGR